MNKTRKLSLLIAVLMLVQIGMPSWLADQKANSATSGPIHGSLYPSPGMNNAPINTSLKIIFDENVNKGNSSNAVTLYTVSDNVPVESFFANSNRITINTSNRSEVTITPSSSLLPNTEYRVLIDPGTFINVSNGAPYAGITNGAEWRFTTAESPDRTRPTIATRSPEGSVSLTPLTTTINMTFSKPVYAASGDIVLRSIGNTDNRFIPVTSSGVVGSGTTQITIKPETALQPNTGYTVIISDTNFEDATGNRVIPENWTFTTGQAPVNSTVMEPAPNSTMLELNPTLKISFDQNVATNASKGIQIRRVSDNSAIATRTTVSGNTVTIVPTSNLTPNTAYYVWMEAGAVTKPAPNADEWFYGITSTTAWVFSTGDTSQPVISTRVPAPGGTLTSVNGSLTLTFNKEVFPNRGNIEIRQVTGGALFRSIPVTSTRVTGGGTRTLTIDATTSKGASDPAKSFVNNTRYYVTMGNQVIRDGAGNYFGGIADTSWNFIVTQDGVRPSLQSLSPTNGTTTVAVNQTFAALFDKPVKAGNGGGAISFIPERSTGQTVNANYRVDPNNSRQILFTPSTPLVENTKYYVNIEEGAITDLADNAFIGILNQYQWAFTTIGGDRTPPALSRSEVSGSVLRLIYNEPLKTNEVPSPARYYVTVAGAARNVTAVKIEGNMVLLTLASSVSNTQKVVVSYSKPASDTVSMVRDLSGNAAANLNNVTVTNGYTSTNPTVTGGSVSGSTVVLNFSESLTSASQYAYAQFTVTAGGNAYVPTAIWQSGNVVQLTLSGSIPNGQTTLISYSPGSYPLQGISGNSVAAFSNYNPVTGAGLDTTIPQVQYINASGTLVSIKYNKTLNTTSTPSLYQYSVVVDNAVRTISSISLSGDTVLLYLTSGVTTSQSIKVSYASASTTVTDTSGNAAASFTNIAANSGQGTGTGIGGAPALQGAILKGSVLTLTYNTALDSRVVPSNTQYLVRVKGLVRMVNQVQVTGTNVLLTLASPANVGETVEVSYYATGTVLKSLGGVNATAFTNTTVANQTTLLDTLTGDYEASDGGGIAIKSSGATTTTDTSPAGVSALRYTVDQSKFVTAVSTSRDAGLTSPRIAFKVPTQQNAALVALSLIPLEMASKQGDVTFAVEYGDISYELPLRTLNFSELSRAAGGNSTTNFLLIAIDKGSSSLTDPLTRALNSSNATILSGPVHFDTFVVNGSNKQQVTNFSGYVGRTLKTTANINVDQTAAVWQDPVTGSITYVPTTFKTENGVTTATFKRQGNSAYALVRNTSSFNDTARHWSNDTVQMMARKFIVEGRSVTAFEPDKPITRGEFATYIAKGLGLTGDRTAAAKFKDVNKDTTMGAYIGAAAAAGIVNGVDSSSFKPNSYITRQDMATMMMRAAKVSGMTVSLPSSENSYLQPFGDSGQISSYARSNMAQSIHLGIINGKSSTRLAPTANATRAEGTVMIMRLLEKAGLLSQ